MHSNWSYRLGRLVYKTRWLIIALWVVLLITCAPFIPKIMDPFKAIGFSDSQSESAKANKLLTDRLGYSYNQFIIIYHSQNLTTNNPKFLDEIKKSLSGLKRFPIKHQIIYPDADNHQISKDKHTAYAVVLLKNNKETDSALLKQFRSRIKEPANLEMKIGGEPVFLENTKTQTQTDMFKAEFIATPVAIITMLVVFGSVVAASLPIVLGGLCALFILLGLYGLGQIFSLSVFTVNIALLLGLCLSLDYALLIISRFREEIGKGNRVIDAIAVTQATAGKAVFFSGLAVFISLSALLFFPINVLFSVGVGGLAAVLVSIATATLLLPAVLSILNNRINLLPIRLINNSHDHTFCYALTKKVVKRPYLFFIIILSFLLLLGYPFLHTKIGISDFRILPKNQESRQVFDLFVKNYGENKLTPILAIVTTSKKDILNTNQIYSLYDFGSKIKRNKNVERVTSIVNTEPRLSKQQYATLYTQGKDQLPDGIKKLLATTTHKEITVFTIVSKDVSNSDKTKELVKQIRQIYPGKNLTIQLTGTTVNTIDVLNKINHIFPFAFLWIMGWTFLVLLIYLRSLILPIKAIITTILSLCASYGVLELVFQQGYLHKLLHFEPQGILDISLLIIIFCALFGISMDYEVFLLSRIKECHEQTKDTTESIVFGINRSGRIITSAAVIIILLCFSFMSADVLIVKAFGLGIAIAVFIDAFIIRTILVPATMAILGKWNWYLPRWMRKVLPDG